MRRAYNLIEIMIVIAIIAFLAAVSYTTYKRSGDKSKWAEVQSCFAEATLRLENYRSNYGQYPDSDHFNAIGIDNTCGEHYSGTILTDATSQKYIVYYEDTVKAISGSVKGLDGWAVVNGSNDIYHYKSQLGGKDALPPGYGSGETPGF